MRAAPFAKALTKHSYQMGVPLTYILPVYLVAVLLFLISKFLLWPFFILAIIWHVYAKSKFEKDEFFLAYFANAMLNEKEHLEP